MKINESHNKMAAMPIYRKKNLKIFSQGPDDGWFLNLVCSSGYSSTAQPVLSNHLGN